MTFSSLPLLLSLIGIAFLGSWHCAAMCGPIAIAIGKNRSLKTYHLGRAISYIALGAIAGFFGQTVLHFTSPSTRVIGLIFLSIVLLLTLLPLPASIHAQTGRFFKWVTRHKPGPFLFGFFSVLLPCGWLWTFVAAAAATGSPYSGALVTGILWLSSLPALSLGAAYFRSSLKLTTSGQSRLFSRVLVAAGLYALWAHLI